MFPAGEEEKKGLEDERGVLGLEKLKNEAMGHW